MHMPNHGSWPNSMLHLDQFVMKVLHICGHARQGNEKVEEGSTHWPKNHKTKERVLSQLRLQNEKCR